MIFFSFQQMCKWIHSLPSVCFTHFLNVAFCLIFPWLQHTGSEDLSLFMLVSCILYLASCSNTICMNEKRNFSSSDVDSFQTKEFFSPDNFYSQKRIFYCLAFFSRSKNSDPEIPVTTFPIFRLFCQDFLTFRRQKEFQLGSLTCHTKQFGLGTTLAIVKCSCCFSLFTCVQVELIITMVSKLQW